ncbi:glycosyl hydrolase family 18 protein [Myxococcota bacterium]|nr:glycosyl hydrolase family 18 protein [Myxococcota bacterium]
MDHPGPHAADAALHALVEPAAARVPAGLAPPSPADGPDIVVYGYWPYWVDELDPAWLSGLTHLAIFNVDLNSDGSLSYESRWTGLAGEVVPLAHAAGVKVHLCVTSFDEDVMQAVLSDPGKRASAVARLATLVDAYGADGVNVDFEGLPTSMKEELVLFTQELQAATGEVWHALPVIDWSGAYDYSELAAASDGLFIMGYAFHGTWGNPGPNDPLDPSDLWGSYSLSWSIDDYLANGAPAQSLVLGLPLYGHAWEVSSNTVPTSVTGEAWSVQQASCEETYARGLWEYDAASSSSFARDGGEQLWCDDVDDVRLRVQRAVDEGLLGVGFWALGYEADGLWEMMAEETDLGGDGGGTDGGGTDGGGADGGGADGGAEGRGTRYEEPGACASAGARGARGAALLAALALPLVARRTRRRLAEIPAPRV